MENSRALTANPTRSEFLEEVIRLKPQVAAFDCDGTLWSGTQASDFSTGKSNRVSSQPEVSQAMRARYLEYKAGRISEEGMCGEMVTMHKGITEAAMMTAAADFMTNAFPGQIFPEMQELVERLQENGCEIWAVSSSNEWVIRAGMKAFGIPADRILATKVELENGTITDRLVRVPLDPASRRRCARLSGRTSTRPSATPVGTPKCLCSRGMGTP